VFVVLALCAAAGPALAQLDPLPAALEQLVRTNAAGAVPLGAPVRGTLSHTDWSIGLSATSCYVFTAVGGPSTKRLSLVLRAPDGRLVAEQKPRAASASLRHCASWSGPYQVQARIEGKGPYLTGVYTLSANGGSYPPPPIVPAPSLPALVGAPSYPTHALVPPPPVVYVPPSAQPVYVTPSVQPVYVPAPIYVPGGHSRAQLACSSSNDCGHGEFCRETSYGDRVCMGHGRHGDACSSSIDCGFGLFCKDRGDDYMICM